VEFYGRQEIKDIICYLRMLVYGDDLSFLRTYNVPKRKIGLKRLEILKNYADSHNITLYQALKDKAGSKEFLDTGAYRYIRAIDEVRVRRLSMPLDNVLQAILDLSGYEEYLRLQGEQERLDNAAELKRSLASFAEDDQATLEEFLQRAALFSNLDRREETQAVRLMTIHTAKGLEFKQVFFIGVSEGIIPSSRSAKPEDIEEERRLAYVAMTRAIDGLRLSDSEGRTPDGHYKRPSRFVWEIGERLMDFINPIKHFEMPSVKMRFLRPLPEDLLGRGDQVLHENLGVGKITEVDMDNRLYVVKFEKFATARGIMFETPLILVNPDS
jgi:DNA helicase-2/ATP-dependent DNA helicase PcrA